MRRRLYTVTVQTTSSNLNTTSISQTARLNSSVQHHTVRGPSATRHGGNNSGSGGGSSMPSATTTATNITGNSSANNSNMETSQPATIPTTTTTGYTANGNHTGSSTWSSASQTNQSNVMNVKRTQTRSSPVKQISDIIKLDKPCDEWQCYLIIGIISVLCYTNSLPGEFVHDDIPAITLNRDVLGTSSIINLLRNDFWGTPMSDIGSHKSYRPLTVLSFRLNNLIFGLNPMWFHCTNVILHATVSILFTRVCFILGGLRRNFAIIAGLLFAVHPIHTEAVTGIVGRADVLACVFFLVSFLIYHGVINGFAIISSVIPLIHSMGGCGWRRNLLQSTNRPDVPLRRNINGPDNYAIWISILLGGLSMLAKETGITVFLLNMAFDSYRCWPTIKRNILDVRWTEETQQFSRRITKVLLSMGVLLAIRLALLQGSLPKFSQQDNPAAFHPNLYVRILTFSYLAAFNWWLLICPDTLSHDWQMGSIPLLTTITDPRNLLTLCAFLAAILLIYRSIIDFEYHRHVPIILGLLFLVLPFLPATNLLVTVGFVVAERVLYIPSLGSILLVVYGAQLLWEMLAATAKYRGLIILMGLILFTSNCIKTISRNCDWYSRESLLRSGLEVLPHNAKMHYNYGNFLRDSSNSDMAVVHYKEALRLWPSYASAHNNLGTLVAQTEDAEHHFLNAIHYSADHVNAHYNLGHLYRKRNRTSDAIYMFERCIKIQNDFTPAYLELVKLQPDLMGGKLLQQVVLHNQHDQDYLAQFGNWLLSHNLLISATKRYLEALSIDARHQSSLLGACKSLRKQGQKARLHQVITRWQLMIRISRRGVLGQPDIYLRDWSIKNELRNRALVYDFDTTLDDDSYSRDNTAATTDSMKTINNKMDLSSTNNMAKPLESSNHNRSNGTPIKPNTRCCPSDQMNHNQWNNNCNKTEMVSTAASKKSTNHTYRSTEHHQLIDNSDKHDTDVTNKVNENDSIITSPGSNTESTPNRTERIKSPIDSQHCIKRCHTSPTTTSYQHYRDTPNDNTETNRKRWIKTKQHKFKGPSQRIPANENVDATPFFVSNLLDKL